MIGEHAGSLLCLAVFITVCLLAAFVTKVRVWKPRFRNVFEKNPRQAVSDTQEIGLADTQPEIEPLGHTHPRAGAILNIKLFRHLHLPMLLSTTSLMILYECIHRMITSQNRMSQDYTSQFTRFRITRRSLHVSGLHVAVYTSQDYTSQFTRFRNTGFKLPISGTHVSKYRLHDCIS